MTTENPLAARKPVSAKATREDLEDMVLSLNAERFSAGHGWTWYVHDDEISGVTSLKRREGSVPPYAPAQLVAAARARINDKFGKR